MRDGNKCFFQRSFIRIGITSNINSRLRNLINGCGIELELVASTTISNYKEEEAYLHGRFDKKRKIGEWFQLSKADVKWIIGYFTSLARKNC